MKVFLSWSGELSHKVALALKDWIPLVMPSVVAWVSSEISKGAQWTVELGNALNDCDYGIICLVPDNLQEPWLNFEAGVISKALSGKVCPFLFGVTPEQIEGPLFLFQCTRYSKDDIRRMVSSLNAANEENPIPEDRLNKIFEKWWPNLQADLDSLKHSDLPTAGGRVRYLKGRNDIYENAHHLLRLADQRVRVVQFFGGPRPPESYAQEAAKILRGKRKLGIDVVYDAYLVVNPSRLPPDFDELIQKRFEIYQGEGVGDLLGVHLLEMNYPEGFGFDMFVVDRDHAHISFTTSERLAALQRGITFEQQPLVVSDLVEWFEQAIEKNAHKYEKLRRKAQAP